MIEENQKARLSDILSYEPDRYLSEEDVKLIQNTFKNNKRLLAVLRKVFLPTVNDPELPVEEFGKDMWLVGADWNMMQNEQVKSLIVARQEAIKFICGAFISLKQIAALPDESPYAAELRKKKDSTK